jgi:hypothetical protein
MPSTLDEWLQVWADYDAYDPNNETLVAATDQRVKSLYKHPGTQHFDFVFKCYNPLNFQTKWTQFDGDKQTLKRQYAVLGDHSQMDKTVCAIFLEYTQGEWGIPKVCDCTPPKKDRRFLLDLSFDPQSSVSHGVQHHGSSVNITDAQRDLIVNRIRPRDMELYELGTEIFAEQVAALEKKFDMKICDKFRTDV